MISIKTLGANMTAVSLGKATLYFSYETCIAVALDGGTRYRTERTYSRTTSGHMTKMGVKNWPVLPAEEFEDLLNSLRIEVPCTPTT